ncbi:MAG: hypothetical protein ACPH7H_06245 [Porticoccaceae bacterium]
MRYTLISLMLGSLLVVGGCSDSSSTIDPVDPVVVIVPPPVAEKLDIVISGSVVDKISGNVIDGAQVEFFEAGEIGDVTQPDIVEPTQQPLTAHAYVSSSEFSDDDSQVTIKVSYLSDTLATGLGLNVHYDSSKLTLSGAPTIEAHGALVIGPNEIEDSSNTDNDNSTDKIIGINFVAMTGGWPGSTSSTEIATLTFDINEEATGSSAINFSASSTPPAITGGLSAQSYELAFSPAPVPPVVATNILDLDGQVAPSVTAEGGSFQITTANGITSFIMVASADGYLSDSVELSFDAATESLTTQISLIAEATEGVAAVIEETVFEAPITTTTAEITITTEEPVSDQDTTEGSAEVVIPAAVELQDAAGNPVAVSTLKVEVTYVEAQEVDDTAPEEEVVTIASVIPEGLNKDAGDAVDETEVLIPIGVAEVNMTNENNVEIKSFSQNITITINLPADTFIPSAERTVMEGDQFTVRSYDEETNLWSTEPNKAIVGPVNADGIYPANLLVNHLTFFALTDGVAVCENPISFNFSGDIPVSGLQFSIKSNDIDFVETIDQDDSSLSISAFAAKLMGVAANAEASVAVTDFGGQSWYSSPGEIALCGETINVALANPVVTVDKDLMIEEQCPSDSSTLRNTVNAIVTYQVDSNSVKFTALETAPGTYTLANLDTAQSSYLVEVNTLRTDAPNQSLTVTPDDEFVELLIPLDCPSVTGTGSS